MLIGDAGNGPSAEKVAVQTRVHPRGPVSLVGLGGRGCCTKSIYGGLVVVQ